MRREGFIVLAVAILLVFFSTGFNLLFNAFALFILAGGIIGTSFSIPSLAMLTISLGALIILIIWPLRERITLDKIKAIMRLQPIPSSKKQTTERSGL